MLGLFAAAEVGVPVRTETWILADRYWSDGQHTDGSWGYTPDKRSPATASLTCEGIAALILARTRRSLFEEHLEADGIQHCGRGIVDRSLLRGVDWLGKHFQIGENFGHGQQWKFYYLDALERVGQLGGQRLLGGHDWFREGVEHLIASQDKLSGFWPGVLFEDRPLVATSFAVMFLSRGRAPILIQKARHGPRNDWMNDPDDVRNLVRTVARDWKRPLNWQVADLDEATVDDLRLAPILFLNGHEAPELTGRAKEALRAYVERGGFLFAEACCGREGFDRGFRILLKEVFPEPESQLHALGADHPVWAARHGLSPARHPLWGLDRGGRTASIYSPGDLSCGWNQRDRSPAAPLTIQALGVGQNVVDYATGRKPPPDKLAPPEPRPPSPPAVR
jgi:hypothetical protein